MLRIREGRPITVRDNHGGKAIAETVSVCEFQLKGDFDYYSFPSQIALY